MEQRMLEDVKKLEQQIEAKKMILEEALSMIDNYSDTEKSQRRRRTIKQILSAEVIVECPKQIMFSAVIVDSFSFGDKVSATISIRNKSKEFDLIPTIQTDPPSSIIRSALFHKMDQLQLIKSISAQSEGFIHICIPKSLFFESDIVKFIIDSYFIPLNSKFSPKWTSMILMNQEDEQIPSPQVTSLVFNFREANPLEWRSFEYLEDSEAIKIAKYVMVGYEQRQLPHPIDLRTFRTKFESFTCSDFDNWLILVGTSQFEGIIIIVESSAADKINTFYYGGSNRNQLDEFITHVTHTCRGFF